MLIAFLCFVNFSIVGAYTGKVIDHLEQVPAKSWVKSEIATNAYCVKKTVNFCIEKDRLEISGGKDFEYKNLTLTPIQTKRVEKLFNKVVEQKKIDEKVEHEKFLRFLIQLLEGSSSIPLYTK